MTHEFLSDNWMNAARAIRAKYEGQTPKIAASIRTLTRDDVVTYLRGVSNAFEDRVLLAYSPGKFEAVPTGGRRVRDAVAFKATAVRQATPDGQATPEGSANQGR